ncbi:vesicle-associated protein 1-2-like [Lolium rigidum]|uniref:vesicle-associated protein 1-2-like n=1 Tax=Lolium rigidum TaxID=89674 RepID=UPI001F5C8FDD|nr:vesicle-associated protein 1-2-like [Lolium rigidum]
MGQGVVEIHPRELQFTFELKKQSSCSVHLVNKSDEYVAFKVKTTSPKRYCVRPNTGVILPRSTCDFTVTMQAQRTAPPDMQLKDKFLVQTTVVPPGTSDEDLIPAFFSKETNAYIDESKLRVVLVDASHPPVEQLINSVPNNDAAVEVPVSRHTLNVENEVPVMEKVVPAPQEQISAVVTDVSSPVKQSPILREVPVIVHEEHAILAESPPPLKNESPPPLKDEYPSPVKDTSAITIEQLPALKENSVTSKESPLEETLPEEAVTLSDRGLFSGQNHQLSHVTEDVQNLKSKLNNLESKLEGAEKMIIKLREESRSMTQERDKLQQEMVFLRKTGTPKSQLGFPLLFVVYVALLGTSLGYLLRL